MGAETSALTPSLSKLGHPPSPERHTAMALSPALDPREMHKDSFGAYLRFLSEYRVGNLAGQVEALRDMHRNGTTVPELAAITGLTEIFLQSIVR